LEDMTQTPIKSFLKSNHERGGAQSIPDLGDIKMQLEPGLWLVATPIGNLGDFSARAQKTMQSADLILAEDTRMTRKLMGLHGLRGKIERCDEAATEQGLRKALEILTLGGAVAFCSDAGTPGISDPGERLARGVIAAGFDVRAIPGPSAAITALSVSGLPSGQFLFAGFSPSRESARLKFLGDLSSTKATLILYETGPRLTASLSNMLAILGDRQACVARELTKIYEETRRGLLSDLVAHYETAGPPKGEIVLVVAGATDQKTMLSDLEIDGQIIAALATHRVKDAANLVADRNGLVRRDIYARALTLRNGLPRA
jgi:16S rRNA (cytidine1402-2'-O)-methyltransferase